MSVGRPIHATVDRAGRLHPTESKGLSVGRPGGRPLPSTIDRAGDRDDPVHAGRPGGRPAFSTGRPGAQSGLLNMPFLAPLIFDLCANFLYSSIFSLPT